MKTNFWMLLGVVMTSALSQACTVESGTAEEVVEASDEIRFLNGDRLSGVSLSGINVGGVTMDGILYTNVTIGGVAISNVHLVGTVLSGNLPGGQPISGADFIGANLTGKLSDGSTIVVKIDDVTTSAQADILNYTVSYSQDGSAFTSLCGVDGNNAPIKSIALAGRWDHSQGTATGGSFINDSSRFTMACRGAAIAKCTELGYKPYQTKQQCTSWGECSTVSMQPSHQACVRMVRADYCGNGHSLTQNGTEIDAFDGLGVHDEDTTAQWDLEAEWTVNGAQCVSHPRWASVDGVDAMEYMQQYCPERIAGKGLACGTADSTFFVDNGFETPADQRVFLRNKSEVHQ